MKIFLIGFMGSGKTYWGKAWAQKSYFDFYDLDEIIELEQKKSVTDIFEESGEDHFRKLETTCLRSFSEKDNYILACGGGTACFNDNIKWMNETGTTVYLSASPKYIYDRVKGEKNKRPLIKKLNEQELFFFIEQRLKEREPFYRQAKIILPTGELDMETIPEFILNNT